MTVKFLFSTAVISLLLFSACEDQGTAPPVTAIPAISVLNPSAATAGDTVTITGTNFGTTLNTSTKIGSLTAALISVSATQLRAIVPATAPTGATNIVVTVSGQSSSQKSFKVISAGEIVRFAADVRSLITTYNCANCHPSNGGFSVATHATIVTRVIPGDGDGSLLVRKLRGTAPGARMPNGGPNYMTEDPEIKKFVDWIDQGAKNN